MVIATCGHTLTESEGLGTQISIKDHSREGNRAISYPSVCDHCYNEYCSSKLMLLTKADEDEWLCITPSVNWDDVYEDFKTYCSKSSVDFGAFEFKRFLKERYKISKI